MLLTRVSVTMPTTTTPASLRLSSIDALRGVAALMVAFFHVWGPYGIYPFVSIGEVVQHPTTSVLAYVASPLRWGFLGVSLFLVLSGFCIHLPFARKKQSSGGYQFEAGRFYLRRMWRLYPAYAVSVIGTFLFITITAPYAAKVAQNHIAPSHTLGDLLSHLTLLHGYSDRYFYSLAHVYWSLALEFQLYLLYPLFLFAFRKIGLTRAVIVLTTLSLAWRYFSLTVFHHQLISIAADGPYTMMGIVFARMPEWLFGVWLAEWFVSGKHESANRISLFGASAVSMTCAILSTLNTDMWVFTDILFGFAFAFFVAACLRPSEKPAEKFTPFYRLLVWSGTISYSIYLFHDQLSWLPKAILHLKPGDPMNFLIRGALMAASIPVIAVLFRFFEKPFLSAPKVGDRFYPLYDRLQSLLTRSKKDVTVQLETT